MKLRLLFLLTVCFGYARAQEWPFELWHEGRIVLLEGDTLKGLVKYDLQQDLVQYNAPDKKIEAYTARKVLFFEIFDVTVRKYRQFFALPYSTTSGYRTPIFFELLSEGEITLLARELLENRTFSSPYYIGSYTRVVLVNMYYFLSDTGVIEEFSGKRNDLLNKMGKRAEKVEAYVKENKLKYDEKYDLARIISYYNSLF